MVNESIPETAGNGERFIAASTDNSHGIPTVVELIQVEGEYRIREFDLTDMDVGYFGLAAAYSVEHIANVWEVMTNDSVTAYELMKGRL